MNTTELNALAKRIHEQNHKWWHDEDRNPIQRNPKRLIALAVSEVSECLEGERKDLMDDHLPERRMAEVEMADAKIRLLDFAAGFKYEVEVYRPFESVKEDKGEALYEIMRRIIRIEDDSLSTTTHSRITVAIGYIDAYCAKHGYDLSGAIEEKLAYNLKRADHSHEARKAAGGKKW